ncbi:MAG: PIN domain-containing protein [Candidatus Coatesbacteria bacterium]
MSGSPRRTSGVLDAGVVLARLETDHPAHRAARAILDRCRDGHISLAISAVNLAEVLTHAHRFSEVTGVSPLDLLTGFRVSVHSPDAGVARRVAELASLEGTSLADRFAAATAEMLSARLYTTDRALAKAAMRRRIPVSLF